MEVIEALRCSKCQETKPTSDFTPRKVGKRGFSSWCKRCTTDAQMARYQAKPERPELAERPCWRCKKTLPVNAFAARSWTCRACGAEYMRERRNLDPDRTVDLRLRSLYGMTLAEYHELLNRQGGGCAICGRVPGKQRLHVDHDHACCPGKKTCGECVRGIVCYPCNVRLSLLESDSDYAVRLRSYLGVTVSRS